MALTSSPNQGRLLPLGVAYTRMFFMGVTGLTLTRLQSKAGGAFGVVAGPVAEVSNGWYKLSMTTSDTDTEGDLANHLTDGGSNIVDFCDQVAAPVKLADKVAHGGDTATLKLLSLEVDNPDGTAVLFTSESNGIGLHVRSIAASGSNQNAVWFQGPRGAEVTAQGCGLLIDSGDGTGSSALGMRAFGAANSHAIHIDATGGLTNGHGILIEGSRNSADAAVYIDASINSASPGIEIVTDGGDGVHIFTASAGSGLHIVTTIGSAILLRPIDGIGIDIRPSLSGGSGTDAIFIGATGVGHGINVATNGSGNGINIQSAVDGIYSEGGNRGMALSGDAGYGLTVQGTSGGALLQASAGNNPGLNIAAFGASGQGILVSGEGGSVALSTDGTNDAVQVNFVTSVDSIGRHRLLSNITKNVALANFEFVMVDSSGVPTAGLTVTGTRSIDGGAYVACTNAVTGISAGRYKISLAAADLNGGVIGLRFAASGAADLNLTIVTTP